MFWLWGCEPLVDFLGDLLEVGGGVGEVVGVVAFDDALELVFDDFVAPADLLGEYAVDAGDYCFVEVSGDGVVDVEFFVGEPDGGGFPVVAFVSVGVSGVG